MLHPLRLHPSEPHQSRRRPTLISVLRWLLFAGYVAAVYAVIAGLGVLFWPSGHAAVALSFVAAAVSAAGVRPVLHRVDRLLQRAVLHQTVTPYSALVTVAGRLPAAGSVQHVLPALARVLAEGIGARHASVWLLVDGALIHAAEWPAAATHAARVADLVELCAAPGVDHAVPILDGEIQRGALAIGKSGPNSVTGADDRLMRDAANSAGLLLRTVAQNAQLHDQLRQAERLELELAASQERLARARDVERRRLVTEITTVTIESLGAIRDELAHLHTALTTTPATADRVLSRLRPALDELIERFRAVVRGVYPGVLRDEGPRTALEELAGDLSRPIRLTGMLGERVDWEIESGIYYAAAAAMQLLGRSGSDQPLRVHLGREDGRLTVRVDDAMPLAESAAGLRSALANDVDRLAALGGGLRFEESANRIAVLAWLPDQVRPAVAGTLAPPATPAYIQAPAGAGTSGEPPPAAPGPPAPGPPAPGPPGSGSELLARVRTLVAAACERYVEGPAGEALLEIAGRLDEPLRVALVGQVKSGKSTLLNALVGQELAGTDATERTQPPTWYRYGARCQITLYPKDGPPHRLEFAGSGAAGAASLGEFAPEAVDRLVVDWPAAALRTMTLIDAPGLDSPNVGGTRTTQAGRTRELLFPRDGAIPTVDAVVYLMRQLPAGNAGPLTGPPAGRGRNAAVTVVGVLSRADEFGGAGTDAFAAAEALVDRHRADPALRRMCQAVVPVSGLLAASALSMREPEFLALQQLAELDERETGHPPLSADGFTRPDSAAKADSLTQPGPVLLARFGIFGVRLAVELIRSGVATSPTTLSQALLRRSGLESLRELLSRMAARADVLKARSALRAVDAVLAGIAPDDTHRDALRYELEEIRAGAHELVEIDLLDRLRDKVPGLSTVDSVAAERLFGAEGPDPRSRLALDADAGDEVMREAAGRQLTRWQQLAENPAAPREVREICRGAVRTCEGLLLAVTHL